jgi:FxsC-like protein
VAYYFFLSYAHADDRGLLERFHNDLCDAVQERTALPRDEIGFRDLSNLHIGDVWPDELADALSSTRVFVAMCSPNYFASEYCRREWQYFTQIARERQKRTGKRGRQPASLLPITWIATDEVPEVVRDLQRTNAALGALYAKEGLSFLCRLSRCGDDYQEFVVRFAERIVAAGSAGQSPVATLRLDFDALANPFRAELSSSDPPARGPKHVHFVVVAAPRSVVGSIRRDTQFYGTSPFTWAPYQPDSSKQICIVAQQIASANDLTSTPLTAEDSLLGLLSWAREHNEIVVLIVDVWTTRLDPYRTVLTEYDQSTDATNAVMVPCNQNDPELVMNAPQLRVDLKEVLPNNHVRRDTIFHMSIPTVEAFQDALVTVLAEAQSRIFSVGPVARSGNLDIERPLLNEGTFT